MKYAYKDIRFKPDTLAVIDSINTMIDAYMAQGYTLSVRQLYYQLVARAVIENTEQSYKRIASIINDGRLAGLIDWDAIEDRNRDIETRPSWDSGASIVRAAAQSFHMDLWDNQDSRVFVIVEKAALAGVLQGVCRDHDVPLLAARGYPSVSVVRDLVMSHLRPALDAGQDVLVLHLGDHDPSGIDMTRDLQERIDLFVEDGGASIEVRRIALTMKQVREVQPPPNPAKTTDSRFREYMREYGHESWELDALEPNYLVRLVRGQIESRIDKDAWTERRDEIEEIRERLTTTADSWE